MKALLKRGLLVGLILTSLSTYAADVTLNWTAPTENEDGSALTDLAGFKIYYGQSTGNYPTVIDVPDPLATDFVVTGLEAGVEYYFVGTAYNQSGVESRYSNEAVKTSPVPQPKPPTMLQ